MRRAHFELHIAVLLFGVAGLFGKVIAENAMTIVMGRTAFAALAILLGLKLFKIGLKASSKKAQVAIFISGAVLAVHWVTFFHAIQVSTVAIGLIGFTTYPVFVTILEPIIFRQQYRPIDLLTAGLVMIGLLMVSFNPNHVNSAVVTGLAWGVLSGALFAVLTLLNRHVVKSDAFFVVAFYQHAFAFLLMLPLVIAIGDVPDMSSIGWLLVLGVFCTALPQSLFIKSLKSLKAQLASVVTGLEAVYAILLAAFLLGELPSLQTVFGGMVVLFAVVIAMRAHSRSNTDTPYC